MYMYERTYMQLRVLRVSEEIACADPELCDEYCANEAGCSNIAFPLLVLRIMPTGTPQWAGGEVRGVECVANNSLVW